jgi:hydroxymethylpyrimidine/phosphomethylpyrimidine kinase
MPHKNKPENQHPKRVLVVAESDATGSGGIQGDTKTILALGGYAMSALTALTAQDAHDLIQITDVAPEFVSLQMRAALETVSADAIKIGFIQNEDTINAVADVLDEFAPKKIPIVMDPSIIARSGDILVGESAIAAWKRRLYIHAKILTPNLREAELLGAMNIKDIDDMRHAADMMRTLGVENVILKGGRAMNDSELYFIATSDEERIYERQTLDTPHTLGAGSAFSSALALNLAKGQDIFTATENALDFVNQAIAHSGGFGSKAGSINHAFDIQTRPSVFRPEEIRVFRV